MPPMQSILCNSFPPKNKRDEPFIHVDNKGSKIQANHALVFDVIWEKLRDEIYETYIKNGLKNAECEQIEQTKKHLKSRTERKMEQT